MEPFEHVSRAHWGDLEGMNIAGLVRLSFELDTGEPEIDTSPYGMTGRDIKGKVEQEKDCRSYVDRRKGSYVYTYVEPSTSAWKRKQVPMPDGTYGYRVRRPIFEGALKDLKRGVTPDGQRLDGLVVYDIDRLTRDNRHLEDAIEVVQLFGRPIIDITGTLDLLTDNGRTVARMIVAAKGSDSAATARRVRRKHRALEQAGIPTGGRRPFGWKDDKRTLDPFESRVIREAAERLANRVPIGVITTDWNDKGILTPLGNKWCDQTVKTVFRNPRLAGFRSRVIRQFNPETCKQSWRIEMVRRPDGTPVLGLFDAVLTPDEWNDVISVIGDNVISGRGRNTRTYLMTGTLRCGREGCGGKMRALKAHVSRVKDPTRFYYTCESKSKGGCGGGVTIVGREVDEWISAAVIRKYEIEAERRNAQVAPEPWPNEGELVEVRADLAELAAARKERRISAGRYFAMLPELEAQEIRLLRDQERWAAKTAKFDGAGVASIRADWSGFSLMQKRAYIEEALAAVIVLPANGRRGFHADRLELAWRG
ncbi:recombinase family protein [Kutzneria buriramensis]|uniref:Recombinase n=1 Tax=Kutzneria buriramensis TaxID=1045776 RepID=A0A3E0HYK2_9PSEU|nr:recombinase family protein [Kutzneria buriramensis]REH51553.1 recombinase [Kutzneria buriramensis]